MSILPLLGGLFSFFGAKRAANVQENASAQQMEFQRDQWDQIQKWFEPYRQAGQTANNALMFEMGLGDRPANYLGYQATPGYEGALNAGQNALAASAAARGNVFSGAAGKAAMQYGQDLASQDYGNYMAGLQGIAGQGLGVANSLGTAGQNFTGMMGQTMTDRANSQSAGIIGGANALSTTMGNLYGMNQYNQAMGQGGQDFVSTPFNWLGF